MVFTWKRGDLVEHLQGFGIDEVAAVCTGLQDVLAVIGEVLPEGNGAAFSILRLAGDRCFGKFYEFALFQGCHVKVDQLGVAGQFGETRQG